MEWHHFETTTGPIIHSVFSRLLSLLWNHHTTQFKNSPHCNESVLLLEQWDGGGRGVIKRWPYGQKGKTHDFREIDTLARRLCDKEVFAENVTFWGVWMFDSWDLQKFQRSQYPYLPNINFQVTPKSTSARSSSILKMAVDLTWEWVKAPTFLALEVTVVST